MTIINPNSHYCGEILYTVSLNTGTAWLETYGVYAYDEQDAVDLIADYLEANELHGLYCDWYEIMDNCGFGETPEEYAESMNMICAGNHGVYISVADIRKEIQ